MSELFQAFPVVFTLMTGKSKELYTKIRELVPNNSIEQFMSDFENANRQAVREVFVGITMSGCWFHYAQCIIRKTGKVRNLYMVYLYMIYHLICIDYVSGMQSCIASISERGVRFRNKGAIIFFINI